MFNVYCIHCTCLVVSVWLLLENLRFKICYLIIDCKYILNFYKTIEILNTYNKPLKSKIYH